MFKTTMSSMALALLLMSGLAAGAAGCGDQDALVDGTPVSQAGASVGAGRSSSPVAPRPPASTIAANCAAIDFHDGTADGVTLGARNQVFGAPAVAAAPVDNYESQVVFPNSTLTMTADFGEAVLGTTTAAVGTLAELAIPTSGCAPLAGRKVRVKVLWRLDGAIGATPDHDLSLGTYEGGAAVSFSDATFSCVPDRTLSGAIPDGGCGARTLNTLNAIELVHTFAPGEQTTGGLFLRVHLVTDQGAIPTTFHIASIVWE